MTRFLPQSNFDSYYTLNFDSCCTKYEPDIVKGTVLFDEGVVINGDQNVENSELC